MDELRTLSNTQLEERYAAANTVEDVRSVADERLRHSQERLGATTELLWRAREELSHHRAQTERLLAATHQRAL